MQTQPSTSISKILQYINLFKKSSLKRLSVPLIIVYEKLISETNCFSIDYAKQSLLL